MTKKYDTSSIKRYAGLKGIRKKPTPYIGPNDGNGLWTCVREPLDNCVDLSLKGIGNNLAHLVFDPEPNVYWILDNGPGFPVGVSEFENEHGKVEKLNTFYVATGLTHAGSNFDSTETSRGTHGIGIKATNAMSKRFQVWTCYKGQWWTIKYKDTVKQGEPEKCKAPKLPHGLKVKKGSVIRTEPDLSLFTKGAKIEGHDIQSWCELTAYLVPGIQVKFTNRKGKTFELHHKRGPIEFIEKRVAELKCVAQKKVFQHHSKLTDVVIAFTDADGDQISAFTNGLRNKDGGEHVRAAMDSMYKSLKPYWPKARGKDKDKSAPFSQQDLRDGLVGLVNCKIAAPKFNNQPKDRLDDDRVYGPASEELKIAWSKFWEANKSLTKNIVDRAMELNKATTSFKADKKMIKNVNSASKNLKTKLSGIVGNAPVEKRELIIVEGDSAAGTAKRARNKAFQAIYALRGKPLNAMEAAQAKVSNNAEIVGLLAAIGVKLDAKNEEKAAKAIQYGKIIKLADPDVDGKHINVLIDGNIWKYAPHIINSGRMYAVLAPLYKCIHKGRTLFGMTKDEIYKQTGSPKVDVQYIKGWGEISEDDMGVALDPGKRTLIRISPPSRKEADEFQQLLGKSPEYRKKLLGVG